jgi:hypothetical protein
MDTEVDIHSEVLLVSAHKKSFFTALGVVQTNTATSFKLTPLSITN